MNREIENVTESPKVQDNLDKAKAARRAIIRYVQLVNDEEYVGTLLDANEKVVEAIQLYDKVSNCQSHGNQLTISCPNQLFSTPTLIPTTINQGKPRLRTSTWSRNDLRLRSSRRIERENWHSSKLDRNESLRNKRKGVLSEVPPPERLIQICKISTLDRLASNLPNSHHPCDLTAMDRIPSFQTMNTIHPTKNGDRGTSRDRDGSLVPSHPCRSSETMPVWTMMVWVKKDCWIPTIRFVIHSRMTMIRLYGKSRECSVSWSCRDVLYTDYRDGDLMKTSD